MVGCVHTKRSLLLSVMYTYTNKCSDRSIEVKLPSLLRNYDRQANRPTDQTDTRTNRVIGKFHFQQRMFVVLPNHYMICLDQSVIVFLLLLFCSKVVVHTTNLICLDQTWLLLLCTTPSRTTYFSISPDKNIMSAPRSFRWGDILRITLVSWWVSEEKGDF